MRNIKQGKYPYYCLKNDKEFVDIIEEDRQPLHTSKEYGHITCKRSRELFKRERVGKAVLDMLSDVKEHLIGANTLGDNQSKTLLLPQPNKNSSWRQSIRVNPNPNPNVRANINPNMRINTRGISPRTK